MLVRKIHEESPMVDEDYEYDGNVRCRCGEISNGWHTCPFKEEIHNNTEECNCCD